MSKPHPVGGRLAALPKRARRQIAAVKRHINKGAEHVHGLFFDRLFPGARIDLKVKALEHHQTAFFKRGDNEILQPSIAFFSPEIGMLITDAKRFDSLTPKLAETFSPTLVMESRSHRARFWVNKEGRVIEFKGLTPLKFDAGRINPNSGQPQGLFVADSAKTEVLGLNIIGDLMSEAIELGDTFEDLQGYAQIYRAAMPEQRYFSWMRMDSAFPVYELLAELEGKSVEEFLYESGQRFGKQLRRLHKEGVTLHEPFPGEEKTNEPFFSTLHSGNVDPYGNIVDLEGARPFDVAFEEMLANWDRVENSLPIKALNRLKEKVNGERSLKLYSRASDLHTFLAGREGRRGPSLFERIFYNGRYLGSPKAFLKMLSGIIHGYYDIKDTKTRNETEKELTRLISYTKENGLCFSFLQTLNILIAREKGLPF